jgi:hypothetical protein
MSAQVQRRGGAGKGGRRVSTIAVHMTTVMFAPNSRPSPAMQPPSVTCTRDVIVQHDEHASQTWTRAHPVMTPTVKKFSHHGALSAQRGHKTACSSNGTAVGQRSSIDPVISPMLTVASGFFLDLGSRLGYSQPRFSHHAARIPNDRYGLPDAADAHRWGGGRCTARAVGLRIRRG